MPAMTETLPLFEDLGPVSEPAFESPGEVPGALSPESSRESSRELVKGPKDVAGRNRRSGGQAHLHAARRLSRSIRRLPDRSPEQTRVGLAICRHLQALLADSPV